MKKTKNSGELQSRREFFKKAAKGALPILGAIILAGTPSILNASESAPMGCNNSCYNTCTGCRGTCITNCAVHCAVVVQVALKVVLRDVVGAVDDDGFFVLI